MLNFRRLSPPLQTCPNMEIERLMRARIRPREVSTWTISAAFFHWGTISQLFTPLRMPARSTRFEVLLRRIRRGLWRAQEASREKPEHRPVSGRTGPCRKRRTTRACFNLSMLYAKRIRITKRHPTKTTGARILNQSIIFNFRKENREAGPLCAGVEFTLPNPPIDITFLRPDGRLFRNLSRK